jgi:putative FmdB family regulatory protein
MPTYHYICDKCQTEFELFQPMRDAPLHTCPRDKCGQKKWGRGKVRRVLSGGAGILFKGSGFYSTDYRSDGYKQAAKKEAEAAAPKTDTAKSDTAKTQPGTGAAKNNAKPAKPTA